MQHLESVLNSNAPSYAPSHAPGYAPSNVPSIHQKMYQVMRPKQASTSTLSCSLHSIRVVVVFELNGLGRLPRAHGEAVVSMAAREGAMPLEGIGFVDQTGSSQPFNTPYPHPDLGSTSSSSIGEGDYAGGGRRVSAGLCSGKQRPDYPSTRTPLQPACCQQLV